MALADLMICLVQLGTRRRIEIWDWKVGVKDMAMKSANCRGERDGTRYHVLGGGGPVETVSE